MEFLFSVFTPTYNRANTIGRTYEYLCKQTLRRDCRKKNKTL